MEHAIEAGRKIRKGENGSDQARSAEWRNLVADVEDLIKKVAHVDNAEIAEMRAKVEKTLSRAKAAAGDSVASMREYARDATRVTDEYVHDSPWAAIGIAAAAGVLIGFLASTTTRR
jgi:ElaB/YqjD/DUF883 family membrane-anchored ribosome-binding protein